MDVTLYRVVGGMNRVALGALADGVEFFTAVKHTDDQGAQDGTIVLTPVRIVDGTLRRTGDVNADDQQVW